MAYQSLNPYDGKILKTFEELSDEQLEMGKLIEERRGEVALSADIIDYYAQNAERFLLPFEGIKHSGCGRETNDMSVQYFASRHHNRGTEQ